MPIIAPNNMGKNEKPYLKTEPPYILNPKPLSNVKNQHTQTNTNIKKTSINL